MRTEMTDQEMDRLLAGMAEPDLGDVWCSKCPRVATRELTVTNGSEVYTASYCPTHIWPLIAPAGGPRPHNP